MKAKLLKSKAGESSEKFLMELDKLKNQALDSYQKWQELKDEYKRAKEIQAANALNELKENIRARKEEFEMLLEQWEFLVKNYMYVQSLVKA
jgi:peptidoglycan hydrolase CwlO-like protein